MQTAKEKQHVLGVIYKLLLRQCNTMSYSSLWWMWWRRVLPPMAWWQCEAEGRAGPSHSHIIEMLWDESLFTFIPLHVKLLMNTPTHHPLCQCQMTSWAPVCSPHINIIHADRESWLLWERTPSSCPGELWSDQALVFAPRWDTNWQCKEQPT